MADFNAEVRVDLTGNITTAARAQSRAIEQMTSRSARALSRLRSSMGRVSAGIDSLGNRYTGLVTGGGLALAARRVMTYSERLTYLGIQAQVADEKIEKLNDRIYKTSQAPDINIDPGELLAAVEKIVEKTGDLEFAEKNLRNLALAIRGAKAQGLGVGGMFAEFLKFNLSGPDEVIAVIDTITAKGKLGAFTLGNMADQGERLFSAYGATGRTTAEGALELADLSQVARMGTGSPEMAATAVEAILRALNDGQKQEMLQGAGIQIFDPEALKKGKEILRSVPEIIKDIIRYTGGKNSMLGEIFGAEAMRGINTATTDFKNNGDFRNTYDKFSQISSSGEMLSADAERAAKTANAEAQSLVTTLDKFSQDNLEEPLKEAAAFSRGLDQETRDKLLTAGVYGSGGLAGLWAANKALRFGGGLLGKGLGGKGGRAGALGVAAGAAAAQPVYVTNWPSGGYGGGYGAEPGAKAKGRGTPRTVRAFGAARGALPAASGVRSSAGRIGALIATGGATASRAAGRFVRGAGPLGLGLAALNLGSAALSGDGREVSGAGGAIAGGLAGAKLGAVIGSLGGPIGTAAGTILLGGLGAYLGEDALKSLYDSFAGDDDLKQEQNSTTRDLTRALDENTRVQQQNATRRPPVASPHFNGGLIGGQP